MEAKERALHIAQKMGATTMFDENFNDGYTLPKHVAQKCAHVLVDEMLRELKELHHRTPIGYWNKVKQEIDKI